MRKKIPPTILTTINLLEKATQFFHDLALKPAGEKVFLFYSPFWVKKIIQMNCCKCEFLLGMNIKDLTLLLEHLSNNLIFPMLEAFFVYAFPNVG